jgi:cyclic dehypoxanthinyl futalosine synthase
MSRLSDNDALDLYLRAGLHELGGRAHAACCARHPEPWRTFVVDRNVNYTNVCATRCRFCAFSVDGGDARGYVLATEAMLAKIDELVRAGGTQVLLQGGMHPDLGLEFYLDMIREIRRGFPAVQIHAFSPPEIWFFHEHFGLSVAEVIARLVEAGLSSIPGGGAEILVDRVRRLVSPKKCTADQWLSVMEQAHALGLCTTATMMFGHVETPAERIEHLRRLRELQDRSLEKGKGRFTAFICWTFQAQNTELGEEMGTGSAGCLAVPVPISGSAIVGASSLFGVPSDDPAKKGTGTDFKQRNRSQSPFSPAGAITYLRTLAVARLMLDNFDNLQASWVTQGPKVGQLSLFYGANDMGGVMMEENVVAAAGTSYRMDVPTIRRLITDAGWEPRQRDGFYRLL